MNPSTVPNPLLELAVSTLQKILLGVGAYFVGRGVLEQSDVTWIAGAAPVIVGAAWSFYTRWQAHKVAVAATNAGVDVKAVKVLPVQAANPVPPPNVEPIKDHK